MRTSRLAGFVVLLMLAGCAHEGANPPLVGEPSPRETDPAGVEAFEGSDCFGLGSFTYWAASTGPAGEEVPPGWEYTQTYDPALTSHYYVDVIRCALFTSGDFEQQAVTMLWESHTQANFPPSCFTTPDSNVDDLEILVAVWVDSEAVAARLRDLGMPIRIASFLIDNRTRASVEVGWKWQVPNGSESSLYLPLFVADEPRSSAVERMFYHDRTSVTALEWKNSRQFISHFDLDAMYGQFYEPMIQAESATESIVANGGAFVDGSFSAELQRYGDLECEEPL